MVRAADLGARQLAAVDDEPEFPPELMTPELAKSLPGSAADLLVKAANLRRDRQGGRTSSHVGALPWQKRIAQVLGSATLRPDRALSAGGSTLGPCRQSIPAPHQNAQKLSIVSLIEMPQHVGVEKHGAKQECDRSLKRGIPPSSFPAGCDPLRVRRDGLASIPGSQLGGEAAFDWSTMIVH